ncbi:MAG: hypothetical protein HY270_19515 [Deltaproteobacteria bacterium]|nr:hypothetical protein [Deltaproteobacteria bacterium]
MPAITLGVAEVEAHLQGLKKRLNTFAAIGVVCSGLTVFFVVSAAGLAVGWYQRLAARGTLPWVLLCGFVLIGACVAWEMRRRWLDLAATTELIDRRASLAERLTTLLGLRSRPRSSELAPLLVAQVIAALPRCAPHLVAPFQIPRSAYGLAGSLVALALASRMASDLPPPGAQGSSPREKQTDAFVVREPQEGAAAAHQPGAGTATTSDAGSESSTSGAAEVGDQEDAATVDVTNSDKQADSQADGEPASLPARLLALLPEEVRRAVVGSSGTGQSGQRRPLGESRDGKDDSAKDASSADKAGQAKGGEGERRNDKSAAESGQDQQQNAAQRPDRGQSDPSSARMNDDGKTGGEVPKPSNDEKAPPAGGGSSPSNVMDSAAATAALEADAAPKTFKLTITSFLQTSQLRGAKGKYNSSQRVHGGSGASEVLASTAPSDQQLRDDILHKAEIPPEYEDLVRRVYSARSLPDEP